MIRLVIVDDQTLMREGLRGLLDLTDDTRVIAEGADGDEAIHVIKQTRPDVVLLDVRMPKRTGIDVLRTLHQAGNLPPTILLTTFDDDAALLEGIRSGAQGFLLKDVSLQNLAAAIRRVAAGESLIRPAVTERLVKGVERLGSNFDSFERPEHLTRREVEVLRLMAGGRTNREIADALGTSEGTIKNHATSVFSKLGVRSRTQAVLKGIELGQL